MKPAITYTVVFLAGLGLASAFLKSRKEAAAAPAIAGEAGEKVTLVSAPGRVEPVSEEVRVGSPAPGRLKAVLLEEGAPVRRGQIIAIVDNADYQARVGVAEAQVRDAGAALRRVLNGAREQERQEAWAAVKEAEAVLENARAEMARRQELYQSGDISRSEVERSEREYQVAKARCEAARQHHSFIDADAREEDRAKAEADLLLSRARLEEARAYLEKTYVRSPLDGVVLRRHLRTGELVTDKADAIYTLGDESVLRVRAEVDEIDVARVHAGQRAYVTAEAYGGKKFWGRVVRVGSVLGKKGVTTERPSERVDTKILETLIELDRGQQLPAGLRVDAFIG